MSLSGGVQKMSSRVKAIHAKEGQDNIKGTIGCTKDDKHMNISLVHGSYHGSRKSRKYLEQNEKEK